MTQQKRCLSFSMDGTENTEMVSECKFTNDFMCNVRSSVAKCEQALSRIIQMEKPPKVSESGRCSRFIIMPDNAEHLVGIVRGSLSLLRKKTSLRETMRVHSEDTICLMLFY